MLPVRIDNQYVWLERYYKLQSWDRYYWEMCGICWSTDYLLTYESYLRNKNNEKFDKRYYAKYFNKESED